MTNVKGINITVVEAVLGLLAEYISYYNIYYHGLYFIVVPFSLTIFAPNSYIAWLRYVEQVMLKYVLRERIL